MAKENLREFFREKRALDDSGNVNWPAKKTAWLKAIENLYNQIQRYLSAPIKDGTVALAYRPKQIVEDFAGDYQVDELVLRVGSERAVFSPKGMNIVGASGRVDLRGDMGEVTIVRQPDDRWGVVATRIPALNIVPFNEESLLAALKSVMRQ